MERGSKKIKHLLWDWVLLPQLSEEVATTASTSLDGKMVRPLERLPVKDDSWGWGGGLLGLREECFRALLSTLTVDSRRRGSEL